MLLIGVDNMFVLMHNIPINNFLVMSVLPYGPTSTNIYIRIKCLAQGNIIQLFGHSIATCYAMFWSLENLIEIGTSCGRG